MARRLIPMVEIDEVWFRYEPRTHGVRNRPCTRAIAGDGAQVPQGRCERGTHPQRWRGGAHAGRSGGAGRRPAVARVEPLAAHRAQLEAWLGEPDMTAETGLAPAQRKRRAGELLGTQALA
jgi:hypothetical protein